jgi:hypothetical protein
MVGKNLLSLHEAIAVALLSKSNREATFQEIVLFIEKRNFFPERKGNIPLSTQIMLRATKSRGAYKHLFEEINSEKIKLRNY